MNNYSVIGLGLTSRTKRSILSGASFNGLFGTPNGVTKTLQTNPSITDTMRHMANMIVKHKHQTKKLYAHLTKDKPSNAEFLKSLFDFQYQHIQYKEDEPGKEQLRQPNAAWRDRATGIDCDCYSIFTATTILHHPTLIPVLRVVRQPSKKTYHHVYVVVPKTPNADLNVRANYWVIDPVLDRFDTEVKYAEKLDLNMADFVIQELGSVAESAHKCAPLQHKRMISPSDLRARLTAERKLIASGKINIGTATFTNQVISALDEVLNVWADENKRTAAISNLRKKISQPQALNGFFEDVLNNQYVQAGLSLVPGGTAASTGLKALLPSGGPSAKQGTAQTIWFWKYFPGNPRYKMPVIKETDSASYRENTWRPLLERESGGIPLEQMESLFETAMKIEPNLVDKQYPSSQDLWRYIQKVATGSNSNNSTNSISNSITNNKMLLWGGLGLLGLATVATIVVVKKRNKNGNGK